MAENPLFVSPDNTSPDVQDYPPATQPASDKDYEDFLAWKRSRSNTDNGATPPQDTTTIEGDPRSAATVPPVTDTNTLTTRESEPTGRGWQGGELAKPAPKPVVEEEPEPQSYVWLTDGSVERVLDTDLPGIAGHGAQYGHWERDGKVYNIVAVYPVEIEPKKEK